MVTTTSPVLRRLQDRRRHVGDVLDEDRLDLSGHADRARQRPAVGGDDRRFARRIDFGEQQRIRPGEHRTKSSNRSRVRV